MQAAWLHYLTKESFHDVEGIRAYMNGHLYGVLVRAMIPGSEFLFLVFFFFFLCLRARVGTQSGNKFFLLSGWNNMGGKTFEKAFLLVFFIPSAL